MGDCTLRKLPTELNLLFTDSSLRELSTNFFTPLKLRTRMTLSPGFGAPVLQQELGDITHENGYLLGCRSSAVVVEVLRTSEH
jgi:hypothetical protein